MKNKFIKPIKFVIFLFIIVIIITLFSNNSNVLTIPAVTVQQPSTVPIKTPATVKTVVTPAVNTYSLADVAKHRTAHDCWTAVNGSVYNLTSFVNSHPGGVENITSICGVDGTALFMGQHGGQSRPENELKSLFIGKLSK